MKIAPNKVVSLQYELHENDLNGKFVEKTTEDSPLTFIYGVGQMLPEFEKNLMNLEAGSNFEFGLESKDAYGEYMEGAIIDLSKEIFVKDGKFDSELVQVDRVLPMQDQNGRVMHGKIKEIKDDVVVMDFNHPMAGKDLYFSGKIIDIREATEDELSHGHVHTGNCEHC